VNGEHLPFTIKRAQGIVVLHRPYLLRLCEDFFTLGERVRRSLGGTVQRGRASEGLVGRKGASPSGKQSSDSSGKLHGGYMDCQDRSRRKCMD
jgi:hypothetical protein